MFNHMYDCCSACSALTEPHCDMGVLYEGHSFGSRGQDGERSFQDNGPPMVLCQKCLNAVRRLIRQLQTTAATRSGS